MSGNAETQAIARRWAHSRDRGGALMFAKIYGARRDRTSTYLDDDEGATELIERETHLADVRARPNFAARRGVRLGACARGFPEELTVGLKHLDFCRAFENCISRKCIWVSFLTES